VVASSLEQELKITSRERRNAAFFIAGKSFSEEYLL